MGSMMAPPETPPGRSSGTPLQLRVARNDDNPLYAITEAEFQSTVVAAATAFGWKWWHISDARRSVGGRLVGDRKAAGLTDLLLVHGNRGFVFAELKREDRRLGKLRPAQEKALDAFGTAALQASVTGCKVRVHLWRPSDYDTVVLPLLRTGNGPTVYGF